MNNHVEYNPTPIYNRKALRNMIRERAIEMTGRSRVNAFMSETFKRIRKEMIKQEEK